MPNLHDELARCDRELAEIDARPELATTPAYLIAMGRFDWQREKELIEQEISHLETRPKQRDCQVEPPYPGENTVLFSLRFPEWTHHLPTERCSIECPHRVVDCNEWNELALHATENRQDTGQLAASA